MWETLLMLSPFVPHITEEIAQTMFKGLLEGKSIHLEKWPESEKALIDEKEEKLGNTLNSIVAAIRKLKSCKGMGLGSEIGSATIYVSGKEAAKDVLEIADEIKATMRIKKLEVKEGRLPEGAEKANESIAASIG
jgi:valyl-tRNA synthetase